MNKLLKIQTELKAPKNLDNEFGGFKYRSAEHILEALKPLLDEHKMLLVLTDEMVIVGDRIYVKATASLLDLEKTDLPLMISAFAREPESKKGMDASQITGTASSYARKYALNGMFLIDDQKDPDSMNNEAEAPQQTFKQAPPQQYTPAPQQAPQRQVLTTPPTPVKVPECNWDAHVWELQYWKGNPSENKAGDKYKYQCSVCGASKYFAIEQ